MIFSYSLQREIIVLIICLLIIIAIGALFDAVIPFILISVIFYVLWHLYHIHQLIKWLNNSSKNPPESIGVWDEVFFQLHNKNKRQKKSRKKLSKLLKRFQKSTQALPYATIVLNSNNEIEWFNPASKKMFGFRAGVDTGQRIGNLIRQPDFIKYLNNKNYDKPLEFENQHKKLLLNVTRYGKGQYLLSIDDITLRKQLDVMRSDFISNVSHELRTPITVMAGYIETLSNDLSVSNQFPIDKIQKQTLRMEKIISELIELAKLETSKPVKINEKVNISKLLNEVYNEALSLDNNLHKIELKIDDANISMNGSYEEIRVAISNLLTNAIRYTPEGGEIVLSTLVDEEGFYINVKDNGIGIEYAHIPRLTERFYRVDSGRSRKKGGTGLGLAIVKQILDRHNAILHIESELDKGSSFSCYFPLTQL